MLVRARFMLGESGHFEEGITLRVQEDRVVERSVALSPREGEPVVDLGNAMVIPGWINAHAHLELGELRGALPRGVGFVPWVRELVAKRRGKGEAFFDRSIDTGLVEALDFGTTTLAEVTTTGRTAARYGARPDVPNAREGIRLFLFEEAIAFDPGRAPATLEHVTARVESIARDEPLRRRALAPHAPYTASAELLHALGGYAARHRIPLSIHVSETLDELRMFASGDGDLYGFLDDLGEIPAGWKAPRCSPIEWLDRVGTLALRPLLVHANYLDDHDIGLIRRSGATVVFCPRSHRFFGHEPHPVRRLRAAGVSIALGTDSLASNDSFSMRAEAAELASRYGFSPEDTIAMAFEGGARALGRSDLGRLSPGAKAELAVYATGATDPRGAAAELLDSARAEERPLAVFGAGTWLRGPSLPG